ncbi:hypothetical protein WA026_013472 [Henosepilachna vigintioctopunctata]|uniref:Uncharacterized protein n=1 Tax=Henosepilachna vigintioctopunctata TaxID=420089 RepID=A0AAW1VFT5_9CUCU
MSKIVEVKGRDTKDPIKIIAENTTTGRTMDIDLPFDDGMHKKRWFNKDLAEEISYGSWKIQLSSTFNNDEDPEYV